VVESMLMSRCKSSNVEVDFVGPTRRARSLSSWKLVGGCPGDDTQGDERCATTVVVPPDHDSK
jgi:hypothetical protein